MSILVVERDPFLASRQKGVDPDPAVKPLQFPEDWRLRSPEGIELVEVWIAEIRARMRSWTGGEVPPARLDLGTHRNLARSRRPCYIRGPGAEAGGWIHRPAEGAEQP